MQLMEAQNAQHQSLLNININSSKILVQSVGYLSNVGLGGQTNHDIQLLQLDIDGIIIFDKENLDFLLQDLRPGY